MSRLTAFLLILPFTALPQTYIGSKACAVCHTDIAKSYAQTAMAQASGRITDLHLPDGQVLAAQAHTTYSVTWQDGKPQLHYRKQQLDGSKALLYYIGSGTHGRGFIFEEQGQPFQSPIAYFGGTRGWDIAPGYESETSIFISRKVETACLNCHTSGLKPAASGLFDEGAVSCERCHGPGEQHAKGVKSAIVNPNKLAAEQRDSICAQCHLTGETRVVRAGKSETSFRPGDLLTDHIVPFVWATPNEADFKVVGHFEGLWQSKCKRISGDKLACLTCHDPHVQISDSEKSDYYRQKCLTCHQPTSCKAPAEARTLKSDSCIACHMQQRTSTDGQHTAFTDHSIRRNPAETTPVDHPSELTAFWPARATPRDYALAEADEAWLHPDAANFQKAHDRLQALSSAANTDGTLAAQLAYTDDLAGESDKAESLYQQALKIDPNNLLALTNLGTHLARKGQIDQAIDLWRRALTINPGLSAPALNMARGQLMQGKIADARETISRLLSLNPDSEAALALKRSAGL